MNIETVKRYSLIEVVFLAILMVGLLLASLIVKKSAKILLSDPISLFGSGVSVSVPVDSGWEHTRAWRYEESENSMTLVGQFRDPSRGWIGFHWRFILSTPEGAVQDLLKQQAADAGMMIRNFETLGEEYPITFARMLSDSSRGEPESVYLGLIRLDYNRSLELFVKSFRVSHYYEENIFKTLVSSIGYERPQKLVEGHILIDEFLKQRSQPSSAEPSKDEVFLIKDAQTGVNMGYYTAIRSLHTGNEKTLQRYQIQQREPKNLKLESSLWFNAPEEDYRWQTNVNYPGMRTPQVFETDRDKSGSFFVKSNVKATKTFPANQFFLPEPLLPELARTLLKSESDGVIVDILGFTGQLVPVYLEKVPAKTTRFSDADAVVRVVYLSIQGAYEELFFDKSQHLLGKYEQIAHQRGRIWEAVSIEELQQIFQVDLQASEKTAVRNRQMFSENKLITLN